jgi:uncharacterized protein (TIGR00251 family)
MVPWLQHDDARSTLTLRIHAQPNARSSGAAGLHGDALKLRIAAPAVDDKANTALLRWIATALEVPPSSVTLKSGHSARRKVFVIAPASAALVSRAEALTQVGR